MFDNGKMEKKQRLDYKTTCLSHSAAAAPKMSKLSSKSYAYFSDLSEGKKKLEYYLFCAVTKSC